MRISHPRSDEGYVSPQIGSTRGGCQVRLSVRKRIESKRGKFISRVPRVIRWMRLTCSADWVARVCNNHHLDLIGQNLFSITRQQGQVVTMHRMMVRTLSPRSTHSFHARSILASTSPSDSQPSASMSIGTPTRTPPHRFVPAALRRDAAK
jgi:hypothetical protein